MKNQILAAIAAISLLGADGPAHAEDASQRKPQKKHTPAQVQAKQPPRRTEAVPGPAALPRQPTFNPVAALIGGEPLVWRHFRIYGAIDAGGGWESHSAPFNGAFPQGSENAISANSNRAGFVAVPGGLGYSNIGAKGAQDIFDDIKGVFDVNTSFDPYSLQLSNGAKSLIQNNGISSANPGASSANGDSARNGQIFTDYAFAGLSSATLGALTFGRQRLFSTDDIKAFDPMGGSLAFSLLGYSSALNGGSTEATRLNRSLKYAFAYHHVHAGALVQIGEYAAGESGGRASYQFHLGADFGPFSAFLDAGHASGATTLSTYANAGFRGARTLANVLSDNDQVMVGARYAYEAFTLFGGYQYFKLSNPSVKAPLMLQTDDGYGGYAYTDVYITPRVEQVFWTGVKYAYNTKLDLIAGYTHVLQSAYAAHSYASQTPAQAAAGLGKGVKTFAACNTTASSNCSGAEDAVSFVADYRYTANLDLYGGMLFTAVSNGLASGALYKTEWAPTIGLRYSF